MSERRPERKVGDLPGVAPMMMEMMAKETKDPATATETVVQTGGANRSMPVCGVIRSTVEDVTICFSGSCWQSF